MERHHQEQLQRLQQHRRAIILHTEQDAVNGNGGSNNIAVDRRQKSSRDKVADRVGDPMIYPGLYAPSNFDIMSILIGIRTRPNPTYDIGNVDSSVSLVLVDPSLPDMPVVYCSEAFCTLTGYSSHEFIGYNCRFLQRPPNNGRPDHSKPQQQLLQPVEIPQPKLLEPGEVDLKIHFARNEEARVMLVNYKKDHTRFVNLLTTIPITVSERGEPEKRYIVGFQAEAQGSASQG